LKQFSIDVQDYGALVGYRIASKHPDAIQSIVVQNGNAYEEDIGGAFDPMKPFWANPNSETEKPVRDLLTKEMTMFQYTHGITDLDRIRPDSYTVDQYFLDRPGNASISWICFTTISRTSRFMDAGMSTSPTDSREC
jgi:hypothetical protein